MGKPPRKAAAAPDTEADRYDAYSTLVDLFSGHDLTRSQRKVAQYILDNASEVVFLSASELADKTEVSQPSISRFAQAIGLPGYASLIRELRQALGAPRVVRRTQAATDEVVESLATEAANLLAIDKANDGFQRVEKAAQLLVSSDPLVTLGFRASASLAQYFAFFARKFHRDVRLIDAGGSYVTDTLEQAHAAGARALLAFVLPRYPREAFDALETARALGYQTVVVSNTELAPFRRYAEHVLVAGVGSSLVFNSQAAPMYLTAALLDYMCKVNPTTTQKQLDNFDRGALARHVFDE